MDIKLYDEQFYKACEMHLDPARRVAAIVERYIAPRSIVDFGCGVGSWLKAFDECFHPDRLLGLDGAWLRGNRLLVPEETVRYVDLTKGGVNVGRFDLVMSVETAEHIPEKDADQFIANLVSAGDVVLFSAAVPFQGGTNHVNERWQSYWREKFKQHDFVCADVIRPALWKELPGIYAQNLFFYVNRNKLDDHPKLKEAVVSGDSPIFDMAHPCCFEAKGKYSDEDILIKWAYCELEGRRLSDWLVNNGVRRIALYGMGVLGRLLLKYFKN